ncbi:hypothetical protein B0H66DRAFT_348173 [Apodospora peruviana]|uniref:Uncharacterized protein n=1 Tax=Apodospora peruviana TaxID=516989 RepID=A0AAE0HWK9_9PEZI|nr:hypothetical protein B0H66DRAFT_348173 [Apodospora peruviana]
MYLPIPASSPKPDLPAGSPPPRLDASSIDGCASQHLSATFGPVASQQHASTILKHLAAYLSSSWRTGSSSTPDSVSDLRKRDALQDQNITIGVVVGVVLAVFFAGLFYFLHRYRNSIQFSKKRRPSHRSSRYGSSKGSQSSSGSGSSQPGP